MTVIRICLPQYGVPFTVYLTISFLDKNVVLWWCEITQCCFGSHSGWYFNLSVIGASISVISTEAVVAAAAFVGLGKKLGELG